MDYLTYAVTFFLGFGAGWTLKIIVNNKISNTNRKTSVSQKNNIAGGDIVAGDLKKHQKG